MQFGASASLDAGSTAAAASRSVRGDVAVDGSGPSRGDSRAEGVPTTPARTRSWSSTSPSAPSRTVRPTRTPKVAAGSANSEPAKAEAMPPTTARSARGGAVRGAVSGGGLRALERHSGSTSPPRSKPVPRRRRGLERVSAGRDVGHVRIRALRHAATRRREREDERRHSLGRGGERRGAHDGHGSVAGGHPLPRGQHAPDLRSRPTPPPPPGATSLSRRRGKIPPPRSAENDARGLAEDTPPPRVT